ncbi:MAG TPA: hypothetical protein VNL35_08915 [Chloroflexota bacterium]|nr:hypothetical protein [Chloroflexota bacterium]
MHGAPATTPLRVLLVEGHPSVRAALLDGLGRAAIVGSVAAVGSLSTAVAFLREIKPDIVVCDPRTLRGRPLDTITCLGGLGCPLVAHTSSVDTGEAAAWEGAGAAAVILKGGNLSSLLAQLASSTRSSATPEEAS